MMTNVEGVTATLRRLEEDFEQDSNPNADSRAEMLSADPPVKNVN